MARLETDTRPLSGPDQVPIITSSISAPRQHLVNAVDDPIKLRCEDAANNEIEWIVDVDALSMNVASADRRASIRESRVVALGGRDW